jgi:hypothetical protein
VVRRLVSGVEQLIGLDAARGGDTEASAYRHRSCSDGEHRLVGAFRAPTAGHAACPLGVFRPITSNQVIPSSFSEL